MNIHTQLCTFKTADNERLHGLLFTPPGKHSDLALVFVHGVAMNFYLPPLAIFAQELVAAAGANSSYKIVDGGNHFYNRHASEIVEIIYQWLAQFNA